MKYLYYTLLLLLLVSPGCQEDDDGQADVDADGLTPGIRNLIPPEILEKMEALGMPIYGGQNPPLLEGTYTVSPFVIEASSHPNDFIGQRLSDYTVTFREQDNENLTIVVDYVNGPEAGAGVGGFIVGEGCNFTVVADIDSVRLRGGVAQASYVLSGTLLDDEAALGGGIFKFRLANLMIDDNGDPNNVFIEEGEGRVVVDKDGYSPRDGTPVLDWKEQVPDCPCAYDPGIDGTEDRCGEWLVCGEASQEHHYGATYEIRWIPPANGAPGQQCTYDSTGALITGGIAAGSPDRVSPRACGFDWGLITNGVTPESIIGHVCQDVVPWGDTGNDAACIGQANARPVSCATYLAQWPANVPDGCPENIVSGIEHLSRMVNRMHCADVTTLLRVVARSPYISDDTKAFFAGDTDVMPDDIAEQLQRHLDSGVCVRIMEEEPCRVMEEAVRWL